MEGGLTLRCSRRGVVLALTVTLSYVKLRETFYLLSIITLSIADSAEGARKDWADK
jgi:hypothetical protein